MNTDPNHGCRYLTNQESHGISTESQTILNQQFLQTNDSGEYVINGGGNIAEYLLRLSACIEAMQNKGLSSGLKLDEKKLLQLSSDEKIELVSRIEKLSSDLEAMHKFLDIRSRCIAIFGKDAIKALEQSLCIDTEGVDSEEYISFIYANSRKVGSAWTYVMCHTGIEKERQILRKKMKKNPENLP